VNHRSFIHRAVPGSLDSTRPKSNDIAGYRGDAVLIVSLPRSTEPPTWDNERRVGTEYEPAVGFPCDGALTGAADQCGHGSGSEASRGGGRQHAGAVMLHLQHMETIGVRELQQHASAALRRVERGETIGVTDRGRLVAVLSAPSTATGVGALLASGRVQSARRPSTELPDPVLTTRGTAEVLNELRDDR